MKKISAMILILSVLSACSSMSRQSANNEKKCHASQKHTQSAPVLTQEQIQKAVEAAAVPGAHHKKLNDLTGAWTTKSTFYNPNGTIDTTKGSAKLSWVLGNRFVEEKFKGSWMGKPFQGIGYTGYDSVKNKFVSSWIDTTSTGIMMNEGVFNDSDNSFEFITTYTCPVSGKSKNGKSILKIVSKDLHIFEMFDTDAHGKQLKLMTIEYSRRK